MSDERPTRRNPELTGTWLVDLDGVVWLAGEPIDRVGEAVARLRERGVRVVFATNNSAPTLDELVARMRRAEIAVTPEDLLTSAQAAASLVARGDRVLALADGGAREALVGRGAELVEDGPVDAVVVGWTHEFTFDRLAQAATAVREGARLIGTNEDPTHPTPRGLLPGAGALLVSVEAASGRRAEVAGKPHHPMIELVTTRCGEVTAVVGDRPSTDGLLAGRLGAPFALVLSGVTAPGDRADPAPDVVAGDLFELVARLTDATPA